MLSNKSVADVMIKNSEVKSVLDQEYFHDAIKALNKNRWGAVFILDKQNKLLGILTDGDARRVYANNQEPIAQLNSEPISKYMNSKPTKVLPDTKIFDLLKTMNQKGFLCAPIVNEKDEFLGVVHMQHLVAQFLKSL